MMADGGQLAAFGASSLGTPVHRLQARKGRKPRTIDCGKHGQLTRQQIAEKAGISLDGVRVRLNLGWSGAKLCTTRAESRRIGRARKGACRPTMVTAMRLALTFPSRMPTPEEIQAAQPMEYRAAIRWRAVIRAARTSLGLPL